MTPTPLTDLFRRLVAADGLTLGDIPGEVIKCERCRVEVPVRAVGISSRCVDPQCPIERAA